MLIGEKKPADRTGTITLAYGVIADIAPPRQRGGYVGIAHVGYVNPSCFESRDMSSYSDEPNANSSKIQLSTKPGPNYRGYRIRQTRLEMGVPPPVHPFRRMARCTLRFPAGDWKKNRRKWKHSGSRNPQVPAAASLIEEKQEQRH